METESLTTALNDTMEPIRNARWRKMRWTEVANYLAAWINDAGVAEPKGQLLEAAAEVTGYTRGILERFLAVRAYANTLSKPRQVVGKAILELPFTVAELLVRLHAIDPAKTESILPAVRSGQMRVAEVRAIHAAAARSIPPHSRSGRIRRLHELRAQIFQLVQKDSQRIVGYADAVVSSRVPKDRMVQCDIILSDQNGKVICAIEVKTPAASRTRATIFNLISTTALGSTFFDTYWIIFAEPGPVPIEIVGLCNELGLANTGVAFVESDALTILRKPDGAPLPDRRSMLPSRLIEPPPS